MHTYIHTHTHTHTHTRARAHKRFLMCKDQDSKVNTAHFTTQE